MGWRLAPEYEAGTPGMNFSVGSFDRMTNQSRAWRQISLAAQLRLS